MGVPTEIQMYGQQTVHIMVLNMVLNIAMECFLSIVCTQRELIFGNSYTNEWFHCQFWLLFMFEQQLVCQLDHNRTINCGSNGDIDDNDNIVVPNSSNLEMVAMLQRQH